MATKTNTSETSASESVPSVEKAFSDGLEQLNAGDLVAAGASFKFVQEGASNQGILGLARTARCYLAGIQSRLQEADATPSATPEMSAQLLLNQKSSAAALAVLDQAIAAGSPHGTLYYLKAVAHAQQDQPQESADALAKAVEADADYLYQFRLEPDFDSVRHSGPFAALLRA